MKFNHLKHINRGFLYRLNLGMSSYNVTRARYLLSLLISILLIYFSVEKKEESESINIYATTYLQNVVDFCYSPVYFVEHGYYVLKNLISAYHKNEILENENNKMKQYITNHQINVSNQAFMNELVTKNNHFANIIPLEVSYISQKIGFAILKHQGNQNIKLHNAVICQNGLAGRVVKITDQFIKVILINHFDSYITVKNIKNASRCILNFTDRAKNASNLHECTGEVRNGDIFTSMSPSPNFQSNLPVGIGYITNNQLILQPFCNFDKINTLAVVTE